VLNVEGDNDGVVSPVFALALAGGSAQHANG
jgi:hypothetical protein